MTRRIEPADRAEYDREVRDIARSAREAYPGRSTRAREDRERYVYEAVDGHQWVIYTAYHHDVLAVADDPDTDGLTYTGDWGAFVCAAVASAMIRDALAALSSDDDDDDDDDDDATAVLLGAPYAVGGAE